MILPIRTVQEMQQTYATISHDARQSRGYNGAEPELKVAALEVFAKVFPGVTLDPRDITVTCITFEGEMNECRLVFRAYWTPSMDEVELAGGRHGGRVHHLQFPHSTVTFPSGMRSSGDESEKYELAGFDTETRRFVFRILERVA